MKKKLLAAALSAAMTLSLAACTAGQTVQPAEMCIRDSDWGEVVTR